VPEPRDDSRALAAPRPVQIDASTRDAAAYAARRRRGDSGPFKGKPVEIRNGLPFRPYQVPGLEFPGCGCIARTSGALIVICQFHAEDPS
jgi:hypothetical protein